MTDADIHHVIRFALYIADDDEDRRLYLGPDNAANMIEIVSRLAEAEELVIHAMPMQTRYQTLLRGLGASDA